MSICETNRALSSTPDKLHWPNDVWYVLLFALSLPFAPLTLNKNGWRIHEKGKKKINLQSPVGVPVIYYVLGLNICWMLISSRTNCFASYSVCIFYNMMMLLLLKRTMPSRKGTVYTMKVSGFIEVNWTPDSRWYTKQKYSNGFTCCCCCCCRRRRRRFFLHYFSLFQCAPSQHRQNVFCCCHSFST